MKKYKYTESQRRAVIQAVRDWAHIQTASTEASKHKDFLNTVINGKRQNAVECLGYVKQTLGSVITSNLDQSKLVNLVRRAVGKGSQTETASLTAMNYFDSWIAARAAVVNKTQSLADIVKRPASGNVTSKSTVKSKTKVTPTKVIDNTAIRIQQAIANTDFSATELMSTKYTIPEFMARIGIKVVS